MWREWALLTAGLALVATAMYLIQVKVVAIKVGAHSSRLVGVACALVAYYYFRHGFALSVPRGGLSLDTFKQVLRVWVAPMALFSLAAYDAVTIFANWRSEFMELVQSTAWLAVVVALVVAARFVLNYP